LAGFTLRYQFPGVLDLLGGQLRIPPEFRACADAFGYQAPLTLWQIRQSFAKWLGP
jgi:hypothetical protein